MATNQGFVSPTRKEQSSYFQELGKEKEALTDCLLTNRFFQQEVSWTISQVQCMLDNNLMEQKRLERDHRKLHSQKGHMHKANKKPISLFAHPYFRDCKRRVAPMNEDALLKKTRRDINAYFSPSRPWGEKELAALSRAVYETALQQELKPYMNRKIFLRDKLTREKLSEEDELMMTEKIELIDGQMYEIRKKPKLALLQEMDGEIDWLKISAIDLDGLRGPEECEKKWKNLLHPSVNRKRFSKAEDGRLKFLAIKHGERDWDWIAKKLNTNRTSIQCMERYQTKLNKRAFLPYWTPEEDIKLLATIQSCQIAGEIPWHQVVYHMPGWSRTQIVNRWNRSIKPETQCVAWTTEEDAVLYGAYKKYEADWVKIAEFLPRRSNYTCRDRFINFLAPNLKAGDWTLEEDCILINLVSQYGEGKWSILSKEFENRSSHACFQRNACMKKQSFHIYKQALARALQGCPLKEILKKQIVKSKYCPKLNLRRQQNREMAVELFDETLAVLNPAPKREGRERLFTERELRTVSKELLGDQFVNQQSFGVPSYRGMERCLNYHSNDEEDPESEESDGSFDDLEDEDHEEIDKEMEELFSSRAAAGISKMERRCFSITEPKILQFEVLKSLMLKAFNVEDSQPLDSTEYHEVDFAESIQRVLDMFVLPPHDPSMPPVMPPNVSNFNGMLNLLVSQNQLEKMAEVEVSREAMRNFRAITLDDPEAVRKCHLCCVAAKKKTAPPEKCDCAEISRLRERYFVFRKRFLSMFLWPALLSCIPLSEEQIDRLIRKDTFNRSLSRCKERVKIASRRNFTGEPSLSII